MRNEGKPSLNMFIVLITTYALVIYFVITNPLAIGNSRRASIRFSVHHIYLDIHNHSLVVTNAWCIIEAVKWRLGVQNSRYKVTW